MVSVIIEIRSAEGGADSKLLVREQLIIYSKFAARRGLLLELLNERPGKVMCRLSGPGPLIRRFAQHEVGGMRWQRVPPTEKRGRVHSSTITVAVLREPAETEVRLNERDLDIRTTRSGGPGGQHANKTDSAVVMTHKPTGISVRVETESSQHRNKTLARALLRARLLEREQAAQGRARNAKRRGQVGSGMRADKIRTVALQRGTVTDHRSGKKMSAKRYLRGYLEDITR